MIPLTKRENAWLTTSAGRPQQQLQQLQQPRHRRSSSSSSAHAHGLHVAKYWVAPGGRRGHADDPAHDPAAAAHGGIFSYNRVFRP